MKRIKIVDIKNSEEMKIHQQLKVIKNEFLMSI